MPRKPPNSDTRAGEARRRRDAGGEVRIIGGAWRGRKIRFPAVAALRPTPDRVRETVFNWLQDVVRGSRCLDLYAGSGALGFEALSRGAAEVVFVDVEPAVVRHIDATLKVLACDRGHAVRGDADAYLVQAATPFDIIFLDPPFAEPVLPEICRRIAAGGWLKSGGYVYLEAAAAAGAPELPAGWSLLRSKRAGEVGYHLARRVVPGADGQQ